MNKGKYIVLEGPEGVGKTTQIIELERRLRSAGLPVRLFREPDSQSDLTARAIRQLTQDPRYPINTHTEVLLYNAARAQSLEVIRKSVEQGIICVVDRNYLTTLAVQYYGRGDVPDYKTINTIIDFAVGDMQPDLTVVLDAPVATLRARTGERYQGERFDSLDDAFLERVRSGYLWEAKQRNLPVVFATKNTETVAGVIWDIVAKTLSTRNSSDSQPTSVASVLQQKSGPAPVAPPLDLSNAKAAEATKTEITTQPDSETTETYIEKTDAGFHITKAGQTYLAEAVSSTDGNVYAFSEKLSPVTIAAAMARLSRRGDDMRVTILDEFAGKADKDEQLLHRVITAYGDDSVQQLGGVYLVVEKASNLLTKKLEWGRLGSYLEQSTRYIFFDQKDADGKYRYHVPQYLAADVETEYIRTMDAIFDRYSDMVRRLTDYVRSNSDTPEAERDMAWKGATRAQACDAIRPVLPVATESTVGIFASGQAIESLIMHLQADRLPEAQATGADILRQARTVVPMFLERADKPERGGATIAYMAETKDAVRKLAKQYLPDNYADTNPQPVTLVDYWPKNEMLLVPDMVYEHSNLPLEQLQTEVAKWPYSQKADVFKAYVGERLNRRHKPGRAMEKAHYSWDLLCDYGIFRDLQRHRIVDDLEWQSLTPRYGYEIPELVEAAGLSDAFEACFDDSLKLYSLLQQNGYVLEAQYATLLGHRMRWKVTYNAREAFHLHELRTAPQGHPGYRKLVQQMHAALAEVHPMVAESMRFVSQDEDPELTRLAAERYTQFKLQQLENSK